MATLRELRTGFALAFGDRAQVIVREPRDLPGVIECVYSSNEELDPRQVKAVMEQYAAASVHVRPVDLGVVMARARLVPWLVGALVAVSTLCALLFAIR